MDINKLLLLIIVANVLVSIKGFGDRVFFDKYKFQVGAIKRGEKIRMFTSAFLHVDYLHLILNIFYRYQCIQIRTKQLMMVYTNTMRLVNLF